MSKVSICAVIPDEQAIKEEGAAAVATVIEAGDERRARAKFRWQFLGHCPAAQDCAYKFPVYEDKPDISRSALNSWDAEHMQENRRDEAFASFVPVETESNPTSVTFDKLTLEVQNAVMVKFNTCENVITDMVISAQELLQEGMAVFDGYIAEAPTKTPEVNTVYPEPELHAIGWAKHKCIPGAKWPEVQAEMHIWKKHREGERKETGKYAPVVDLAHTRANQQYTENSTGKISLIITVIYRKYKQIWKTLSDELAHALWPGDVDAGDIDGSVHHWAEKEVIDNDREDWKCTSASMHEQPSALRYDCQAIFSPVRERPTDIHKDSVALNKYICEYLTTKGVSENEGTDLGTAGVPQSSETQTDVARTGVSDIPENGTAPEVEPPVEHGGPFYFLFVDKDGEKYGRANKLSSLDKALAIGATEITREEYSARKNGIYTGLPQNVDTAKDSEQLEPIKVTVDRTNKITQATSISQSNVDKLLAVSRGELVEGISDLNDPEWIRETQARDSVSQNQHEPERNHQEAEQNNSNALQNEPEAKQLEPVTHQEVEKTCVAYGQAGGDSCPDCDAVMGNATYQETFDGEYQVEVQEDDPGEMEGAERPHKGNTGGNQYYNSGNETGETANHPIKANGHHEITSTSRTCDHLMIDLETMGKNPDTPIISVGAIFSNPQTGDMGLEFNRTIDLETAGRVIGRGTIKWRPK